MSCFHTNDRRVEAEIAFLHLEQPYSIPIPLVSCQPGIGVGGCGRDTNLREGLHPDPWQRSTRYPRNPERGHRSRLSNSGSLDRPKVGACGAQTRWGGWCTGVRNGDSAHCRIVTEIPCGVCGPHSIAISEAYLHVPYRSKGGGRGRGNLREGCTPGPLAALDAIPRDTNIIGRGCPKLRST